MVFLLYILHLLLLAGCRPHVPCEGLSGSQGSHGVHSSPFRKPIINMYHCVRVGGVFQQAYTVRNITQILYGLQLVLQDINAMNISINKINE